MNFLEYKKFNREVTVLFALVSALKSGGSTEIKIPKKKVIQELFKKLDFVKIYQDCRDFYILECNIPKAKRYVKERLLQMLSNREKFLRGFLRKSKSETLVTNFLEYCFKIGDQETFNKILDASIRFFTGKSLEELKRDGFTYIEKDLDWQSKFFQRVLWKKYRDGILLLRVDNLGISAHFIANLRGKLSLEDAFKYFLREKVSLTPSTGFFIRSFSPPRELNEMLEEARRKYQALLKEHQETVMLFESTLEQLKTLGYEAELEPVTDDLPKTITFILRISNPENNAIARIMFRESMHLMYRELTAYKSEYRPNYKAIQEAVKKLLKIFSEKNTSLLKHVRTIAETCIYKNTNIRNVESWEEYVSLAKLCVDLGFDFDDLKIGYRDEAYEKLVERYNPPLNFIKAGIKNIGTEELAYRRAVAENLTKYYKLIYILKAKESLDENDLKMVFNFLKNARRNKDVVYQNIINRLTRKCEKNLLEALKEHFTKEVELVDRYLFLASAYREKAPPEVFDIIKENLVKILGVSSDCNLSTGEVFTLSFDNGSKILFAPLLDGASISVTLPDNLLRGFIGEKHYEAPFTSLLLKEVSNNSIKLMQKFIDFSYKYFEAVLKVKQKALQSLKKPLITFTYLVGEGKRPLTIYVPAVMVEHQGKLDTDMAFENAWKIVKEIEKHSFVKIFDKKYNLNELEKLSSTLVDR